MPAHRRPPHPGLGTAARASLLSAAAGAVMAVTTAPALAEPSGGGAETVAQEARSGEDPAASVSEAEELVDTLFADAERAIDDYNAGSERVSELEEALEQRQDRLARNQQKVNEQRRSLGSAAAAHYRSGGVDPSLALMLSQDPDGYLDRAATLERATSRQSDELAGLLAASRTLAQERAEATETLALLSEEKSGLADRRDEVQSLLAAAQSRLNALTEEERAAREARHRSPEPKAGAEDANGTESVGSAAEAVTTAAAPVGRGASALGAARGALGLPYVWGQNGPSGFDCAGLTQWAYAQAGVAIPRTSQAQAASGQRVSLDQAQPGDLVVYREDASHVALYAGGGQVIHAPYPGASVRHDPVGMMPVSAVVRP